jgi:hypothetical protein
VQTPPKITHRTAALVARAAATIAASKELVASVRARVARQHEYVAACRAAREHRARAAK